MGTPTSRYEVGLLDENDKPIDMFDFFGTKESAKRYAKKKFDLHQKPTYVYDRMAHYMAPEIYKYDGEWSTLTHRLDKPGKK